MAGRSNSLILRFLKHGLVMLVIYRKSPPALSWERLISEVPESSYDTNHAYIDHAGGPGRLQQPNTARGRCC